MVDLIDFSNCKDSGKIYEGSMSKLGIIYNGENYLLKLQHKDETHYKNEQGLFEITYLNSIFSEYIASNIANLIGLEAHSTLLGIYKNNDGIYNAVACKDFLKENEQLILFKHISQKTIGVVLDYNERKSIKNLTLKQVLNVIEKQNFINSEALKDFFWEMFVFDGYVGNFDRNSTNWGLVKNNKTGSIKIAPIFDNASCLHPKTPRKLIIHYLNNEQLIEDRAIFMPSTTFRSDENSRIKYNKFFSTYQNIDFYNALVKIAPKIINNHEKNKKMIMDLDVIDINRRKLLVKELDLRLEKIIKPALTRAENFFLDNDIEITLENSLKKLKNKWERKK